MRKSLGRCLVVSVWAVYFLVCSLSRYCAAESWIKPILGLREEYDDNIFLDAANEKDDLLTTVTVGAQFAPQLKDHELTASYVADFQMFADNSDQNTANQTFDAEGTLHFNDWRVEANNRFRHFENRTGTEDTARVPRTTEKLKLAVIRVFNKLDVGFDYSYALENYRSDNAIGSFEGQALTYQDLDSSEHSGEVELAFHFWPKTSLLFAGRYGTLKYDTGKKSDSDYFDVLAGLRGRLFARGQIEGKVGFRTQDYKDAGSDFDSVIGNVSWTEQFSERDTLTVDFDRTTYSTIYQQNAYFQGTVVSGVFSHDFNSRVTGRLTGLYGLNEYPTATTENGKTAKREDDLWEAGVGLVYRMPKYWVMELNYAYRERSSSFDEYNYTDNRYSAAVRLEF